MNLQIIRDALLNVGVPVSHYTALKKIDRYIVWAEDSQLSALWADDKMVSQVIQGTIDYFTRIEYDPVVEQIQAALSDAGISWSLNGVQREEVTRYIHYEWVWEIG